MDNIFLLVSKDEFLISKRVKEILDSLEVSDELMEIVDIDATSVYELINELTTVSIFDSCRIFWVKNPTALSKKSMFDDDSLAALKKYISSPLETSYLIFSSTELFEASELYLHLKKYALVQNLDKTIDTFLGFAKNYVKTNELDMTEGAIRVLTERVSDYQTLEQELLKLQYYAMGEKIDEATVDLVVSKNLDTKVYELTNALIAKNKTLALDIYYDLLSTNETPRRIFNNVLGKMSELLMVKKLLNIKSSKEDVANYFGVSAGRAYYMMKAANDITNTTLERYFDDLNDLDYKIKSGIIEEKLGLELFILKA